MTPTIQPKTAIKNQPMSESHTLMNFKTLSPDPQAQPEAPAPRELAERIRLCAEMAGSGDELSRLTGIPRRTLEYYLTGEREPKVSRCLDIARAAGVQPGWLVSGEGPMHEREQAAPPSAELMHIPLHDMDTPSTLLEAGQTDQIDILVASHHWLHQLLGLESMKLLALLARGDSMEPTIHQGDILLIDQNCTRIHDGQIFAISDGETLLVKRLQRGLHGMLQVISDNPLYPEFDACSSTLRVVGRVVCSTRRL